MASVSSNSDGQRRILFVDKRGKRCTLYIGKVPKKLAESLKNRIEELVTRSILSAPIDGELATWVSNIGDELAERLGKFGLIPARQSKQLKEYLDLMIENKKADKLTKYSTVLNYRRVADDLVEQMGSTVNLRDITPEMAEAFKTHYQSKLAPTTVHRRLKLIRSIFEHGRKMKFLTDNPFADVHGKASDSRGRQYYLTEADTMKLLAVAAPEWRTIIALSRFAGFRCPTEVLSLRWEHVELADGLKSRMVVPEPKSERRKGRQQRTIPIFARLRPFIEEAKANTASGEKFVVGGTTGAVYRAASNTENGWKNANLRTTLLKIIERAGLTKWPRLFHNMRASLETDLMQHHPIHVVAAWLGNTPNVAIAHYLQTVAGDFEKANRGYGEATHETTRSPAKDGKTGLNEVVG